MNSVIPEVNAKRKDKWASKAAAGGDETLEIA